MSGRVSYKLFVLACSSHKKRYNELVACCSFKGANFSWRIDQLTLLINVNDFGYVGKG